MTDNKTVTLKRTRDQWAKCDPEAMCHMSQAAIFHALNDAKHDVLAMHDAMLVAAPAPAVQGAGQEAVAWIHPDTLAMLADGKSGHVWASEGLQKQRVPLFTHATPVSGGTQGVWDVYAFGKWQRRVSAPVAWDAHTVYLDMVKNGWSKDIELRGVSSANYSAPVNGGERGTVEVAIALEQQRTLAIVKAVRDINFGESPTGMPTAASAAYDLACEEIERRLRTEQWELNGAAAPLPSAERAADAQQVGDLDALISRYWELAYDEGKTGVSHGDAANLVLSQIRAAVRALTSPARVGGKRVCPHGIHMDNACGACIPPRGTKVGGDEREAFDDWFRRGGSGLADCWSDACEWQRAALSADGGEDKRDAERYRVVRLTPTLVMHYGLLEGGSGLDERCDVAIAANQARKGE